MKKFSYLFFALAFITLVLSSNSYAQVRGNDMSDSTTAVTAEKSRGEDPNVESDKFVNDPDNLPPAPAEKGGEKSRGAGFYTKVIVDNWTGYSVNIYADGKVQGSVAPWSQGYFYEYGSSVKLYGKAYLTDGRYIYWGPSTQNISNAKTYTWKLTY